MNACTALFRAVSAVSFIPASRKSSTASTRKSWMKIPVQTCFNGAGLSARLRIGPISGVRAAALWYPTAHPTERSRVPRGDRMALTRISVSRVEWLQCTISCRQCCLFGHRAPDVGEVSESASTRMKMPAAQLVQTCSDGTFPACAALYRNTERSRGSAR